MRKNTIITVAVLAVLGVGSYVFLTNPMNRDLRVIRSVTLAFMEDLQFKDFRSSSLYHHELERDRVDVGRTLEKLFLVKPELLDIQDFRIVKVDLDGSGDRARTLVRSKYKRLNYDEVPKDGEILLYWIKRHPQCPLGATCVESPEGGHCLDEFKNVLKRAKDESKKRSQRQGDAEDPELTEELFVCDPAAEIQWYMNLDSTLKEKRYNY